MNTLRTWAIVAAIVMVFWFFSLLAGETTFFVTLGVMVASLFLLFAWMVSTGISRRAKKGDRQ